MKLFLRLSVLACCGMFLAGCASVVSLPPSGAAPAMLFSDVRYPSSHDVQTQFKITRDDIEILGPVASKSESQNILFISASGDNGLGKLLTAARKKYPDADGVIDVQWDSRCGNVCIPCYVPIPVLLKVETTAEGKAFKYKKKD